MIDKCYLKQALFKKTGSNQITEACYRAELQTGIKWKTIYDFTQGRSLPRLNTLKILQDYLELDLNKTIL